MIIVVIEVSGSGKTTIGTMLAKTVECRFLNELSLRAGHRVGSPVPTPSFVLEVQRGRHARCTERKKFPITHVSLDSGASRLQSDLFCWHVEF
jgi:hypothetical protein